MKKKKKTGEGAGVAPWGSVDQRGFGAESFLKAQAVDLAGLRLEQGHPLAVVAGLKRVAVFAAEKGFSDDADGLGLIGGLKGDDVLRRGSFAVGFGFHRHDGAGDVVGTPAAAEGGNGHQGERVRDERGGLPPLQSNLDLIQLQHCQLMPLRQSAQRGQGWQQKTPGGAGGRVQSIGVTVNTS